MTHNKQYLENKIQYTAKEYNQFLNKVYLILIVWIMLLILACILSKSFPEVQDIILWIGVFSIIPVFFLEIKIGINLYRLKNEKRRLQEKQEEYTTNTEI